MGDVKTDNGETYFFHKNNEDIKIFNQLKVDMKISFITTNKDGKLIATEIQIVTE